MTLEDVQNLEIRLRANTGDETISVLYEEWPDVEDPDGPLVAICGSDDRIYPA